MPRQKKSEEPSAGAPWLNTFADLMNLLLCFFVLLFASSNIDAEKYEQIAASLSNNFSILQGGGSAIKEGQLISTGIKQMDNLGEYEDTMGEASKETGGNSDSTNELDMKLLEEKKEVSETMYDELADLSEKYKVNDDMEISIDPNFNYVKLSLSGSILFDSGEAKIKADALQLFSKVGDILKVYDDYKIELEGHTDNVPIRNSKYESNNWLSSARALNAATYLIEKKGLSPSTLSWTGRGEYDPVASNSTEEGRAKNRRVEIKIYNDVGQ
jgi:chemotaxis protein MotB